MRWAATPARLIDALQRVPDGIRLVKNDVGNLSLVDENGEFVGYIALEMSGDNDPLKMLTEELG